MSNTPDDDALAEGSRVYASDRHLLLQEIKSLAKEVGKLRGDTKYLNEVTVPREEQRKNRRVAMVLAGLTVSLFGLTAIGLYFQSQRLSDSAYEICEDRNAASRASAKAVVEINALLGSLRSTEEELLADPRLKDPRAERLAAYDRYLDFVANIQMPAALPDCEQFR